MGAGLAQRDQVIGELTVGIKAKKESGAKMSDHKFEEVVAVLLDVKLMKLNISKITEIHSICREKIQLVASIYNGRNTCKRG